MTETKLQNHIASLKDKHSNIEKRIDALYAERAPDQYIQTLKKEKLSIKEEIARNEHLLSECSHS